MTKRVIQISESKALSPVADETAPPTRGDRYGEAFPTATSLDAGQDRENIPKTSAMPYESFSRVTSLGGDEGSLKQTLKELMEFCTTLQSQQTQMANKIQSQDLEIKQLKARIQTLEDAQKPNPPAPPPPPAKFSSNEFPLLLVTTSEKDPTADVLTTARDTTPYTRRPRASRGVVIRSTSPIPISIPSARKEDKRKGKEIMTKPEKPAKVQKSRTNEKILLEINEIPSSQLCWASKSERRKFYTSVLRSHAGWKTKDFRGMTFDQLEEKFIPVWESIQDFVPMDSKKESESLKRSGILLEKVKAKRLKTSDVSAQEQQESDNQDEIINLQQWADKLREVYQIFRVGQAPKVYSYFESMLKDFDRDDLVTLWKLVKDRFKTELPKSDLERCLFWPLKVMFEPVTTDLLWQFEAAIQSWKMYKSCKVHCLSMEGIIIYMLNEVEYPFQKTTLKKMLDHKCEVSEFNEDVIQMINLIRGQLKKE
ncbi:hypothetical protein Tco_0766629 [Tanacetum coccineum]